MTSLTSVRHRPLLGLALLAVAVAVAVVLSLIFGARETGLPDILRGLFTNADDLAATAVRERVPRTVFALVAGAALAVSGALMQALTRNPIADPGILGINTGASLFVVIGIAAFGMTTVSQYLWLALAGGLITAFVVFVIASLGGAASPVKLALSGVATAAALGALVSAITLTRTDALEVFRFWTVGSVGRGDWATLAPIAPLLIVAAALTVWCIGPLNSIALGDELATSLGVKVTRTRLLAALAGVLLSAAITAVAGPIGFVGLMVPHTVRLLTGPDQRWVVPLSALGGAALLTFADTVGRVIARPGELAVGLITAFAGAPVLIAIARRTKVRDL